MKVEEKDVMEERIQIVLSSVFILHKGPFEDAFGPNEIEGWDSLNHLNLIMALQDEFDIELSFEDVMAITIVGDIKNILTAKTA